MNIVSTQVVERGLALGFEACRILEEGARVGQHLEKTLLDDAHLTATRRATINGDL